jgi:predicted esterase
MKLCLLLLSAGLPGLVGDYLKAPAGSEAETKAVEAIRVYWEKDREAVEVAIRSHLVFPAAKPGLHREKIALPKSLSDEEAPKKNEVVVWVPKGYDPKKKHPVFLLVHGTGGFADAEAKQMAPLADKYGFLLVAAQDELRRHGGGWGGTDYEFAIHDAALLWLKRNYNVDDRRMVVSGGSRGGHAAWAMAMAWPDRFAASIPIVGGPRNHSFRFLPNLRHVAVYDMQGAKDQPGLVENVRDAVKILKDLDYEIRYEENPDTGHYFPVDWEKVREWATGLRRLSYPEEITLTASRNDRAGAYWIRMKDLPEKRFKKVGAAQNRTGRALTREEMKKLVRENYGNYAARVDAKLKANLIDLRVKKAPKVVVYLSDRMVNLDEPVTINVNGRKRVKRKFQRSLETMLTRVKETGDRELLYPVAVEVRGASR